MKQSIKLLLASSLIVVVAAFTALVPLQMATVAALDPADAITKGSNAAGGRGATDINALIKTVVNILLFVIGAVAVIMIVIGGIRYTTSNGDSTQVKAAKDTILYAVIGLVVAMLAYAIVNFVVRAF